MHSDVDAIIADLSIRLFAVPPEQVEEAVTASRSGRDRSLVEEIASRGSLKDHERGVLDSLYAQLLRHDAQTKSAYPPAFLTGLRSPQEPVAAGPEPPADPGAGLREEQRYEVRQEHAQGGMGRILKVWDRRMQREVALKEIRPDGGDYGDHTERQRVLARFLQEARITGRLQHPSIIPVHEIGEREDGTLYYTMKFVRGRTLYQAITAAESLEGRMALLPHYLNLCQAVAYAHAHGVIHRDLKPSNVMIGEFGETLVIDWGLAKEIGLRDPDVERDGPTGEALPWSFDLTMDGQLLGTPHYMAPEQMAGKQEELDERADVYALGAVLYELLTGSRPYRASTGLEVLRKAATERPTPPAELCPEAPPALAAICGRAMAREPGARYVSARELAEEVTRYQAGARVEAHQYGLAELLGAFIKRHRPVVATASLLLAVLAGVVCYSYLSLRARHAVERELRIAADRDRYDHSIALAEQRIEEFQYSQAESLLDNAPAAYRGWDWGRLSHIIDSVRQPIGRVDDRMWNSAVSRNGRYAVSCGPKNSIECWDLEARWQVHTIQPDGKVSALAVHPEGAEFASADEAGVLARWNLQNGALIAQYPVSDAPIRALAYGPDGRTLAAGNGETVVLGLETGAVLRRHQEPSGTVNVIDFSRDNQWMAAGDSTGTLYLWDNQTGELVGKDTAHTNNRQVGVQGVFSLGFSPDGALIATGGSDSNAIIWRRSDLSRIHTLTEHLKRVHSVAFTDDSQTLFTDSEGNLKRWEVATGKELPCWIRLPAASRWILLPEGQGALISADGHGSFTRWSVEPNLDGVYLTGHTEEVNSVRFSADGRYLVSAAGHWRTGGDGRVFVWDLGEGGQDIPSDPWRVLEGADHWVRPLAFHPGGRLLSGGDSDGRLLTWDWRAGALESVRAVPEYTNGLRCIAYHPDGGRMATAGWAEEYLPDVTEWDSETGEATGIFKGETNTIDSLAYSPDGALLAAGTRDGVAILWDANTRERIREFKSDLGWVYGIAFSPDGKTLATCHGKLPVRLWDVATGALLRQLEGLHDRGNAITFSADGSRVACSDMRTTRVWNAQTGAILVTLPHGAMGLEFSPDGRTLATAGVDGRVGLWHTEAWK